MLVFNFSYLLKKSWVFILVEFLNINKSVRLIEKYKINTSKSTWVDRFFIKYFFVTYYLYSMSVDIFLPKGSFWGVLLNALLLAFLIYASFIKSKTTAKFAYIYFYIAFLVILISIQSSDYSYSFKVLGKYVIGLFCLPLGFSILSSIRKFREFQKIGIICMLLFLINTFLANVFDWGGSGYTEQGLEMGNLFSDAMYQVVYSIISIFLLIILFPPHRRFIFILSAICGIVVIVSMKRTTMFALFVGMLSYQLFCFIYGKGLKKLFRFHLKYLINFFLLILFFSPFFLSYFLVNWEARQNTFEKARKDFTEEGRIAEFIYITDEVLRSDKTLTLLFGKETFNLVGTYADGRFGPRQIHGDYSILLHGTGIIGCFAWFFIHLYLVLWIVKLKRVSYNINANYSTVLYSIFFSLIFAQCIIMGSGALDLIISSSFFYASLGGILRYFYNKNQIKFVLNQISNNYEK